MTLPTFIGIGAPRAATTWLFRCLVRHPQVFVADVKETNFFDYKTIAGRMAEYEAHFVGSDGAAAIGEISVRYLNSAWAPERIRRILPEVRLFVSLRNPIDQVYSHYWHLRGQNFHQWGLAGIAPSFEEALERYEEKLLGPALYASHLVRWLRCFDRSQLAVIFYDDICTQPARVLRELYEHIGVGSTFVPPSLHTVGSRQRRGVSPRSRRWDRARARIYDQLNRRVYYPLKRTIGTQPAELIKRRLKIREIMVSVFQRRGYPPMQTETRVVLRRRLAADVRLLAQLTGRDLNHWN